MPDITPHEVPANSEHPNQRKGWFILPLTVLVALMVGSIYYPYPNGQSMDIKSFVLFWFRELLILAFVLVVFVTLGVRQLIRSHSQRKEKNDNAL